MNQRLLRFYLQHQANVHKAIASSTGTTTTEVTYLDPADARQLRGIPAIGGRGSLGGAIAGTRPDQIPYDQRHRIGWSTWERGRFDWQRYGPLRNSGLSHNEALSRLDALWALAHPELDHLGWPK